MPLASFAQRFPHLTPLLKLAAPLSVIQFGQMAMGLTDTALLGRVSPSHLAASGIGNSIFFAVMIFGLGVCLGCETLVSQAVGKDDHDAAYLHTRQGMIVAVAVAIPCLLVLWLALQGVAFLGLDDEVVGLTRSYVYGRFPGIFGFFFYIVQRNYVQAYGLTKPAWIATVVANLVNVVADSLLIFGDDALRYVGLEGVGLPGYGAAGAGVATSICAWVQVLVLVPAVQILLRDKDFTPGPFAEAWRRKGIWHIVRVGTPVGLQYGMEVGIFALIALLMGRLSTADAAANQIALNIASSSFSIVMGVSIATSILVGQMVGKGDKDATYAYGRAGIVFGGAIMGASGVVLFFFPEALVLIFTDDSSTEVIAKSVVLVQIAAAFQLGDGIQAVACGALRGAGDTDAAFLGNVFAYWVVGFPVALFLAYHLEWGGVGLWWGLTVGLWAAAFALAWRFLRRARTYEAVIDEVL